MTAADEIGAFRAALEAAMAPEHVAHLRATNERLIRVADLLGTDVAVNLLADAIDDAAAGKSRITEAIEARLTLLERA